MTIRNHGIRLQERDLSPLIAKNKNLKKNRKVPDINLIIVFKNSCNIEIFKLMY